MKSIVTLFAVFIISLNLIFAQNNALRLNGIDESVDMGTVNFNLTNEITVMAWVKWENNPSNSESWANIISNNSEVIKDYGQFWLQHDQNNQHYEFAIQTTNTRAWIQSKTTTSNGNWQHVAGVLKDNILKIYINGVEEDSRYISGNIKMFENDFHTYLGQWAYNNDNQRNFHGSLEDVAILSRGLSATEINAAFMDPYTINTTDTTLEGYWTMNVNAGSNVIIDESQNQYNGVITGENAELYLTDYPPAITGSGAFPVELISMDVIKDRQGVNVLWKTASEQNNDYFLIQRSTNGENFETVGIVDGSGNSINMLNYEFIDHQELKPGTYYYRIQQVDFDGKYEIFDPVEIQIEESIDWAVFPNPVKIGNQVNIKLNKALDTKVQIQLLNLHGQVIKNKVLNLNNEVQISTSGLIQGNYIVRLLTSDNVETRKIMVH